MVARAALVAAIALLALPVAAGATDVSRDELVTLADQASTDPSALEELRAVTSVDGTPVNLEAALAGAEGEDAQARAEQVARSAGETPATGIDAAAARDRVADILGREAPEPPDPPDDFEGGGGSFGGISIPFPLLLILAALLVAVSAVAARSMGRRSVLDWEAKGGRGGDEERTPASDLGKQADDAERRGDFATAVRLRFQAGLVRLHELGSIELRPSLTATGAARESGIGAIAGLARTYERVAFGGREASADDASFQRSEWADIVAEARRKR